MKTALLPALLATLALAACGEDDATTTAPDSAAAPTETAAPPADAPAAADGNVVEVKMQQIKFVPETVEAKVGQTIRWINEDPVPHNVIAEKGADFKSEQISEGGTYEAVVDKAGTVAYVCTIHPGQNGSITVTE